MMMQGLTNVNGVPRNCPFRWVLMGLSLRDYGSMACHAMMFDKLAGPQFASREGSQGPLGRNEKPRKLETHYTPQCQQQHERSRLSLVVLLLTSNSKRSSSITRLNTVLYCHLPFVILDSTLTLLCIKVFTPVVIHLASGIADLSHERPVEGVPAGLSCCLYTLANPSTTLVVWPSLLEANAHIWLNRCKPSVFQAFPWRPAIPVAVVRSSTALRATG